MVQTRAQRKSSGRVLADDASNSDDDMRTSFSLSRLLVVAAITTVAYVVAMHVLGWDARLAYMTTLCVFLISLLHVCVAPIPQSQAYHNFADQRVLTLAALCFGGCGGLCGGGGDGGGRGKRKQKHKQQSWWRVPNAADVLSNFPFVIAGLCGWDVCHGNTMLRAAAVAVERTPSLMTWLPIAGGVRAFVDDTLTHVTARPSAAFESAWERDVVWPVFFASMAWTAAGSAYYHWAPSNDTLVWDRLPMTVAFMSLFAAVLHERLGSAVGDDVHLGATVLVPFLALGASSVWYWHVTEQRGRGDMRPYIVVQFLPLLVIPYLLVAESSSFDHDGRGGNGVWPRAQWTCLAWYVLAKVLELQDRAIYKFTRGFVSGHTLKHLAAAVGPLWLSVALATRTSSAAFS